MRCMIPFWIHLLAGIHHIWVLFVWLQFDKKIALLKILNPGQRREGTSSLYYISLTKHGSLDAFGPRTTNEVPLDPA